ERGRGGEAGGAEESGGACRCRGGAAAGGRGAADADPDRQARLPRQAVGKEGGMTLFDVFKRRGSAPVARERLQLLLAYERQHRNQPDLVAVLHDEIMAVIKKHVQINHDDVAISMERGERMSTLEIDIQIPNANAAAAA